jgi:3-dehydroquinate synthase
MVAGAPLSIDGAGHPIIIGAGLLRRAGETIGRWLPAHRYAIITDTNVAPLHAGRLRDSLREAGCDADVFTFPAGESHKTRDTWATLTDEMLSTGFGRDSSIVALGGGVAGDLAGFVAATFMRGIPFVQVPTTLVAMVDSSIGGKVGVDTPAGKNLVGAFHLPSGVLTDPQVLDTLPLRDFSAGMAEVLKHGVVADASYFGRAAAALPRLLSTDHGGGDTLQELVARSIEIKVEIVRADSRESGRRKVLNFGHTIGHAIEVASGYSLLHGEAVAAGMVLEAAAGELAGITEAGTSGQLRQALAAAGLPTGMPEEISSEAVLEAAGTDKKKRKGSLRFAVPRRIGYMAGEEAGWTVTLPEEAVLEVLG